MLMAPPAVRRITISMVSAMALATTATDATASDPTGVYALIDKVTFHPSSEAPHEVRLEGLFSISRGIGVGDYYRAPTEGTLCYRLPDESENADLARAQWADFERVAGSGEVVGFGSRWRGNNGQLFAPGQDPGEQATAYPLHMEVRRIAANNPMGRILRQTPRPIAPADGATVEAGPVTMVARAPLDRDPKDQYVFVVETSSGEVRASPPLTAGGDGDGDGDGEEDDDEVRWMCPQVFFPGESVTWRITRLQPEEGAPTVHSRFTGKATYSSVATSRFKVTEEEPPRWANDGDRDQ